MSKYNRVLLVSAVLMLMATVAFAGGKKDGGDVPAQEAPSAGNRTINVAALNGPSGIPMAYLFENKPQVPGADFQFHVVAGADVLLPKLLKGEIDAGILPPNVAAKVFTKNNGALVVAAVMGQGMLNLITKDESIASLEDLKGKTVNVAGQGATPEYMFRYLLKSNGIAIAADGVAPDANSVALDFSIPAAEIAAALLAGKIQYAVVPEPFSTVATTKDASVRRAINLQDEFAALNKTAGNDSETYPMTVLVVRKELAETSPHLVAGLLESAREAVEWTLAHPSEAGALVQNHTLGLQASIATKVIPNGAYVFIPAKEAQSQLEDLFSIFLDFAPDAIGGELPSDNFYFD